MNFLDRILFYVYPGACAFCGALMPHSKTGVYICPECMEKVRFCARGSCCSICGAPLEFAAAEDKRRGTICPECFSMRRSGARRSFDRIIAACAYDENSSGGIIKYKRGRSLGSASTFAGIIAANISGRLPDIKFDFVAAVPPRRARIREIGFDQCDLLARKTAKALGVPYIKGAFKRAREGKKQTELSGDERRENLAGAFETRLGADRLKGKTILVIDDVKTTGSTMEECARVLKEKGAAYVCGAAIAATGREIS